jgi:hypothetical protein
VLADEMLRDPHFATQVAETLGRPPTPASGVTVGSHSVFRGDVAGGSIDRSKRYHIGSMRFGGGGLTALIAVGLIAVSGSGAVAYTVFQELAAQAQTRPQERVEMITFLHLLPRHAEMPAACRGNKWP